MSIENPIYSQEENDEETFRDYIEALNLSPEDFEKKILDVGAGSAQFAKWAKDHGVSDKIFSLEPMEQMQETERAVRGKVEAVPFKNESFDLVVSKAAFPNISIGASLDEVKKGFLELLRVTKPGGEIRLGPVLKGELYDTQKDHNKAVEGAIQILKEDYRVKVEEIEDPAHNTYEYEGDKPARVLAKAYLIKIHKPQ